VPHTTVLISTVAAALGVAFVLGLLATRLRLPPIVGYLAAGVVVGPFTPSYVADVGLAPQLAEVGVILLMFGVGLHFSLDDLARVRRVIPAALAQTTLTAGVTAPSPARGAGTGGAPSCSGSRSGWRARWCCSRDWSGATSSTRRTDAPPWAGSSSRT
jgi:CPA2 family monovalent cation:H+ antiporter-2